MYICVCIYIEIYRESHCQPASLPHPKPFRFFNKSPGSRHAKYLTRDANHAPAWRTTQELHKPASSCCVCTLECDSYAFPCICNASKADLESLKPNQCSHVGPRQGILGNRVLYTLQSYRESAMVYLQTRRQDTQSPTLYTTNITKGPLLWFY